MVDAKEIIELDRIAYPLSNAYLTMLFLLVGPLLHEKR